ncbi:hypothetical protein P7D52_07990 [Enterococcus dongliensis]|uniref:Uncharacterized protein n=1 Tax=Enterococcus dongliensis TaxID=2559925 RepID=A0AAW8TN52_9ENTE|nr:hypothetical protein [Enterococcus dongliensis]MDT2635689.1 hypothetical protein [Enterococcus dongliensis]MDT2637655.1 hypothetical protein [Enterococcus dongliensis]MDT2642725.1 hypothetical protein [Enterococcus dongliensis]
MEQNQLKKLMEMNENNETLETTFFEMRRGLSLIAKQSKYLFDECVKEGFTEEQALTIVLGMFSGSGVRND